MLRRWPSRMILILAMLICIAGYIWSCGHQATIAYVRDGWTIEGGTQAGAVMFWVYDFGRKQGWSCYYEDTPARPFQWLPKYERFNPSPRASDKVVTWLVAIPYWPAIVILAFLLWLAWREQAPRRQTGFPVVGAQGSGGSACSAKATHHRASTASSR